MALAATCQFDVQTGGNDTNGGGFNFAAGGTNYSLNAAKNVATGTDDSTTDAVANGTTTITSATANFQASIVGNIIYLQGGTGGLAATRRQVNSRTNATTIVVDATVAAGTGITMNIGGSFLTLGAVGSVALVSGNSVWIKSGTYPITSATTNVAGGVFSKSTSHRVEGYNSTYGDRGTPPLLQISGTVSGVTMITMTTVVGSVVRNIDFDGVNQTTSRAVNMRGMIEKCSVVNFTGIALNVTSGSIVNCLASGCSGASAIGGSGSVYGCVAHTNSTKGFNIGTNTSVSRCISYGNTGANGYGFDNSNGEGCIYNNCVAYGNAQSGFRNSDDGCTYINCIAESNDDNGFESTVANLVQLFNCAAYDNTGTGGNFDIGTDQFSININPITGTATFFVNAAAGDFALNSGEGALLKETGVPGVFPGGLTEGFIDIGAAQSEGGGGAGGAFVF